VARWLHSLPRRVKAAISFDELDALACERLEWFLADAQNPNLGVRGHAQRGTTAKTPQRSDHRHAFGNSILMEPQNILSVALNEFAKDGFVTLARFNPFSGQF
jgi:hypothetical protein